MIDRADIVVDLGFGDAGKGLLTDFLVRHHHAGAVIRFNGGGQAGHRVVDTSGRAHVCSQFGAGVLVPGTLLAYSHFCALHPSALLWENQALEAVGVRDGFARLLIDARCPLTTPFHQAANRLRECLRRSHRHGSVGLGVGETFADAVLYPDRVPRAGDLGEPQRLRQKLAWVQELKREQLGGFKELFEGDPVAQAEWQCLSDSSLGDRWYNGLAPLRAARCVVPHERWLTRLRAVPRVVLEGAQGVLLDEQRGFFPYITRSTCTFAQALALLAECGFAGEVVRHGVIRSYHCRHGVGPFPSETNSLAHLAEANNSTGAWQGVFRRGWLDLVLLRYAVQAAGGVDQVVVTHVDDMQRLVRDGVDFRVVAQYQPTKSLLPWLCTAPERLRTELNLGPPGDLLYQAGLTQVLFDARPVTQSLSEVAALVECVEMATSAPVRRVSYGPKAVDILNYLTA